jgi:hypothetical protein
MARLMNCLLETQAMKQRSTTKKGALGAGWTRRMRATPASPTSTSSTSGSSASPPVGIWLLFFICLVLSKWYVARRQRSRPGIDQ